MGSGQSKGSGCGRSSAGRPVFTLEGAAAEVLPLEHRGNPLPARARGLIAAATGPVLHLSGGGTADGGDQVVELDGAIFGPTDVVGDAHRLPFADGGFDLVVAMNAFEHYRDPPVAACEIRRILRPGGLVFLHTAFLQPPRGPGHYFNCTRYGLERWFERFETLGLGVPDNLHPGLAIAWLASEAEELLALDVSAAAADAYRQATVGTFADLWRRPDLRQGDERWQAFTRLSEPGKERAAAGFEYLGRRSP